MGEPAVIDVPPVVMPGRKPYCESGGTNRAWWNPSPLEAKTLERVGSSIPGSLSFIQLKRRTRRTSVAGWAVSGWKHWSENRIAVQQYSSKECHCSTSADNVSAGGHRGSSMGVTGV